MKNKTAPQKKEQTPAQLETAAAKTREPAKPKAAKKAATAPSQGANTPAQAPYNGNNERSQAPTVPDELKKKRKSKQKRPLKAAGINVEALLDHFFADITEKYLPVGPFTETGLCAADGTK